MNIDAEFLDTFVADVIHQHNKATRAQKMVHFGVFTDLTVAKLVLEGARALGIEYVESGIEIDGSSSYQLALRSRPGLITQNIRHLLNLCDTPIKELLAQERNEAVKEVEKILGLTENPNGP
jgi:hypothetical protein